MASFGKCLLSTSVAQVRICSKVKWFKFVVCRFALLKSFNSTQLNSTQYYPWTLSSLLVVPLTTIEDFRFEYEYENDFSILVCSLHIVTSHTYLIP